MDHLSEVTKTFATLAGRTMHKMVTAEAERHEALEWLAVRRADATNQLNRFVALSVIPSMGNGEPRTFELWAGADDGSRFARQLVIRTVEPVDHLRDFLEKHWDDAIKIESLIRPEDLTFSYLPSSRVVVELPDIEPHSSSSSSKPR